MTTTRTCAYQPCSKPFTPTHPRQRFCCGTCRSDAHYARHPEKRSPALRCVAEHPLAEARAEQEATDLKSKLSAIIYEGIVDRLKLGPVHADDLEPLFPPERRDVCRRLVGAQFGSLASRGYIRETERRKSRVATRKGAKSGVYIFTQKGRAKLAAGMDAGNHGGDPDPSGDGEWHPASVHPGGTPTPPEQRQEPPESAAHAPPRSGGSLALFEDAPPRPLSPVRDAEAA